MAVQPADDFTWSFAVLQRAHFRNPQEKMSSFYRARMLLKNQQAIHMTLAEAKTTLRNAQGLKLKRYSLM